MAKTSPHKSIQREKYTGQSSRISQHQFREVVHVHIPCNYCCILRCTSYLCGFHCVTLSVNSGDFIAKTLLWGTFRPHKSIQRENILRT